MIQNGAPDGLRLMLGLDPAPVDAVSYEGDTAGATEGSGAGLTDTAAAAPAVAESISRCPDGADADVNNADFSLRTSSPGAANVCAGPKVVINEVDYDQPGTDAAEFLELKNTSCRRGQPRSVRRRARERQRRPGLRHVRPPGGQPRRRRLLRDLRGRDDDGQLRPRRHTRLEPDPERLARRPAAGARRHDRRRAQLRRRHGGRDRGLRARPRGPGRRRPLPLSRRQRHRRQQRRLLAAGDHARRDQLRARRRRSSSTRSTTTRSAPTQPSSSSSRTRLPSRSTSIRTSSSS